ncbi:MAG TPA: hypothetical protein VH062_05755 [Polyangiaceae bacterium]|jgi:hypothetical protein|nr:hypothetical protein [Polyangiaceae bacterium]
MKRALRTSCAVLAVFVLRALDAQNAHAEAPGAVIPASDASDATAATPSVAILETHAPELAAAAAAVTRQLYATAARLGYRVVPEAETARLRLLRGPRLLAPADLLAIATDAGAEHAVSATLAASGDRYVVWLTLANADRTGPVMVSEMAEPAGLEAAVDRMTRTMLPAVASAPVAHGTAAPPRVKPEVRLALATEGAFGTSRRFFYNHLAGARLDYVFTPDFALGAYVGYANLAGREGRTSNVLPYLQLEYRLRFSPAATVFFPLRFGTGFLPKNGPYLRLAAGPSFPLGGSARLGLDLVAPTFVIVHDRTVVSLDVAAEVSFAL